MPLCCLLVCSRDQPPGPSEGSVDHDFELKFIIPCSIADALLDRAPELVNAIHTDTGAAVMFSRRGYGVPNPRERIMVIKGKEIVYCKAAVQALLHLLEEMELLEQFTRIGVPGRIYLRQIIPAMSAGKILGPGGEQIAAIIAKSGATVVVEPKPANHAFIAFRYVNYMAPSSESLHTAVGLVANLIDLDDRYRDIIRGIQSVCIKTMAIPARSVGMLLGPGGVHIKSLQDVLRCKMGVTKTGSTNVEYLTIWGSPVNVRVAQDVINLAVGYKVKGQRRYEEEDAAVRGPYWEGSSGSEAWVKDRFSVGGGLRESSEVGYDEESDEQEADVYQHGR